MDFAPTLTQQLDVLSQVLDGTGDDLQAILGVLVDDLIAEVPSFLGLHVNHLVNGAPITLNTLDRFTATRVQASLLVPPVRAQPHQSCYLSTIYYAATPWAFTTMAATLTREHQFRGRLLLDHHLHPHGDPGIAGLNELTVVNQAVGILVDRGASTDEAHTELVRRAHASRQTPAQTATQLVDHLSPSRQHPG